MDKKILEFKCGDRVRVKAEFISGKVDIACLVTQYRDKDGFPRQPTFKTLEAKGHLRKGETFYGAESDVAGLIDRKATAQMDLFEVERRRDAAIS
jgi:hypothetical protein